MPMRFKKYLKRRLSAPAMMNKIVQRVELASLTARLVSSHDQVNIIINHHLDLIIGQR